MNTALTWITPRSKNRPLKYRLIPSDCVTLARIDFNAPMTYAEQTALNGKPYAMLQVYGLWLHDMLKQAERMLPRWMYRDEVIPLTTWGIIQAGPDITRKAETYVTLHHILNNTFEGRALMVQWHKRHEYDIIKLCDGLGAAERFKKNGYR